MHLRIILLPILLVISPAISAVDNPPSSQVQVHQNNFNRRDPDPGKVKAWAAKATRFRPKQPKSASPTRSSASCGTNLQFILEKGGLKDQPYEDLQSQARNCKKCCHCETVAGRAEKQLTCTKEVRVDCSHFCMCELDNIPLHQRPGAWGGSISSTSEWDVSSVDRDMEETRPRSSFGSWDRESVDGEMAEARAMTDARTDGWKVVGGRRSRSGRTRKGQTESHQAES